MALVIKDCENLPIHSSLLLMKSMKPVLHLHTLSALQVLSAGQLSLEVHAERKQKIMEDQRRVFQVFKVISKNRSSRSHNFYICHL